MKLQNLSSAVLAMIGFAATSFSADNTDWAAKGYRWSLVNGPYAYMTKDEAKTGRLTASSSSSDVLGHAYYLRPGKIVFVVETDAGSGLSKIRMGGVAAELWTATKNLTTRPFRDTLGEIETPEMTGALSISSPTPSAQPEASVSPSPTATP